MELQRRPATGQHHRLTLMRTVLWLLLPVLLSACGYARQLKSVPQLIAATRAHLTPDPARVAATPYAQVLVEWPGGAALMVLGNVDDGRQSWFSDKRHLLYLRRGIIAGSFGLGDDAADIRIVGDDPLLRLHQVSDPVTLRRRYDWRQGYRYGVIVEGTLRRHGNETVEILGVKRELVHVSEELRGDGVRATNHYWADPKTGYIWKSQQLLAPGVMVEITSLKPFNGDLS